jgi:hypothetical protein
MRKNGKEENTGKAQESFEAAKKPRRGRKPKAEKQQEETGAAAEPETESEKTEETITEPEAVSEKTEEISTEQEAGQEQETAQEKAEMPAAETESADEEQTGAPPETAPEADTEPGNDTAEESAAGDENAPKEATGEEENTEESGEEPEPEEAPEEEQEKTDGEESGEMPEEAPESLPAPAMPTQVIDSPLKRMKQEFSERSQIIREQMRNIQNAFITIGFQLHWIRENNMFRVLNYKNVYDYAEKEYGLKKTTCCNFISIIENYAERDENGEVIESIADCYRNYSASQLVAMLGMNEDMRQQVTPDMSVRAINRLRKGEPEPGTVETSPAPVEEPEPVKKPETEKDAENPFMEEEPVQDDTVREEEPEAEEMQEAESPETAEDDTVREEGPEDTGDVQMDADVRELPEKAVPDGNVGTLAEIDSYSDYQSMADELDLLMRNVFAEDASVRVKIVCVQG